MSRADSPSLKFPFASSQAKLKSVRPPSPLVLLVTGSVPTLLKDKMVPYTLLKQCCGSGTFWYGSGSTDTYN
jgi:hypothetical protein